MPWSGTAQARADPPDREAEDDCATPFAIEGQAHAAIQ